MTYAKSVTAVIRCHFPLLTTPPYTGDRVTGKEAMNAETPILIHSFRVGRHTVTVTIQRPRAGAVVAMVTEWQPNMPSRLSDAQLKAYRRGRDEAVAMLAARTGIEIAVVEV
jgi:hypothetical protein